LRDELSRDGSVILVGERLATAPGALSAAAALAERTGARVAWVPRRAGERGAVDSGAVPTLLPGGRPVSDDKSRIEIERAWAASVPTAPGRDLSRIWRPPETAS
jgi:NADH-quinone oxidoreductase subunit G